MKSSVASSWKEADDSDHNKPVTPMCAIDSRLLTSASSTMQEYMKSSGVRIISMGRDSYSSSHWDDIFIYYSEGYEGGKMKS